MKSLVKFLFSSDIGFSGVWEEANALGCLSESVQRLAEQLHTAQPELWKEYQEQAEALRDLERWTEFERGFLIAAQLMEEVTRRTREN